MKHVPFFSAALLAMTLMLSGCTPPTPAQIAPAIQAGTSISVSLGLVAIPDKVEADEVATVALDVLNDEVLPILNGDEAGLASGLQKVLELKAFDNPKLVKVKLILEAALPLLEGNLPVDLLDKPLEKLNPDVKAYLLAFFTGARDGLENYLGGRALPRQRLNGLERPVLNYTELRERLKAK